MELLFGTGEALAFAKLSTFLKGRFGSSPFGSLEKVDLAPPFLKVEKIEILFQEGYLL